MDLGAFLDASVGALIGVLGVWAALGRGHWFVRFLVVTPLLLMPVLISAYEMVYHHSFGVLLIVLAIGFYHQWRPWRWRFPVRTILLGMVVVATYGAVIVNSPEFTIDEWLGFFGIGAAIAIGTLLCLWGVSGGGSWFRRAVVLFFSFMLLNCVGFVVYALYYDKFWLRGVPGTFENPLNSRFFNAYFNSEWYYWWFQYYGLIAIMASTFALSLLSLARFGAMLQIGSQLESPSVSTRISTLCRYALAASLVLLSMFPGYVFYQLLTPEPYAIREENHSAELEELAKIGDEFISDYGAHSTVINTGTATEASALLTEISPKLNRIDEILELQNLQLGRSWTLESDGHALYRTYGVFLGLHLRYSHAYRFGSLAERLRQIESLMSFGRSFTDEVGFSIDYYQYSEDCIVSGYESVLGVLSATQCNEACANVFLYDKDRPPISKRIEYERLWYVHAGWQSHLQLILADMARDDLFEAEIKNYLSTVRRTRTLILQLALQRYYLEHKEIPDALTDLVPEYLEALPEDPICKEPLHYQRLWSGYVLTSSCDADPNQAVFVTGPSSPYMAEQLKNYSLKAWTWLGKTIAAPR